jgi:hypothetical protein
MSSSSTLFPLLHCYLAMTPVKELWKQVQSTDSAWLSVEFQGKFVREVLEHPIAQRFPPSAEYRKYLLRLYIDAVAKQCGEYDDDLMELYAHLMQSPSSAQPEEAGAKPYFRSFFLDDDR